MNASARDTDADGTVSRIAAAIGEPARARMLYSLLDGQARTSTDLAIVAAVSPSTASAHLARLKSAHLVKMQIVGKQRRYSLDGRRVARALEVLSVLAGSSQDALARRIPSRLRLARTCYDHLAGVLGVTLHERFLAHGWLRASSNDRGDAYDLTSSGASALEALGVDVARAHALRRRFAYACLDWSERRAHLGGALGAAVLSVAVSRRWVTRDLDSRTLAVTSAGRREFLQHFGLDWVSDADVRTRRPQP